MTELTAGMPRMRAVIITVGIILKITLLSAMTYHLAALTRTCGCYPHGDNQEGAGLLENGDGIACRRSKLHFSQQVSSRIYTPPANQLEAEIQ